MAIFLTITTIDIYDIENWNSLELLKHGTRQNLGLEQAKRTTISTDEVTKAAELAPKKIWKMLDQTRTGRNLSLTRERGISDDHKFC
mmetsp:Transcript_3316/g.7300  ORF Transcript_3316/g.7300 Transcript_3316/m.7300 type:complete len:87 (+) Transcript_3316:1673-1933(+)